MSAVILRDQLTAAIRLKEAGFQTLAKDYYQAAAQTAREFLAQPATRRNRALRHAAQAFVSAWETDKPWRIHYRAAGLYNQLLDQTQSRWQRYGSWLTALAWCALVGVGGYYFWVRTDHPAAPSIATTHANYLSITATETAKRSISSWIELGRNEPGVSRYKRYGSAEEMIKVTGLTDAAWGHLTYPPVVNWSLQSLNDNAELTFYFPGPESKLGKTTAIGLFFTDGDSHYNVPRTVRLKSGDDPPRLVSSFAAGTWVELPVSASEQFERSKTVKLTRLTGNNIAVSAAVFWHEKP